jgi:hypothetical protein
MLTIAEKYLINKYRNEYGDRAANIVLPSARSPKVKSSARQALPGDWTGTTYRFKPNSDVWVTWSDGKQRTYHYNNLSFQREEDTKPGPSPDVYRIITYGDSVTMGYGLEMNKTWPFFWNRN